MARICIITPGQLGSNPRTVKEADALTAAGHDVTVISTRVLASVEPLDQSILAVARWSSRRVEFTRRWRRWVDRLAQRAAAALQARRDWGIVAAWAQSERTRRLTAAALKVPADLYIAHYVAALPAAAAAARRNGAPFGFDAEDFHPGDLADDPRNATALRAITAIERRLLPRAAYVTAASPGIAAAYAERYAIATPHVVLNVFPRAQAPAPPGPVAPHLARPSLYWFSQVIGPDRGLECVIAAIARSRHKPLLCLRGLSGAAYTHEIRALADRLGVANQLEILPPASPAKMEKLAAAHTIGLALETGHTHNRRIALTNKQFTYLLAGLPVLMSDIPAHQDFAASADGAAFLFRTDDPSSLAERIDFLLDDGERLQSARLTAYRLGQEQFNWDGEQARLLAPIEAVLRQRRSAEVADT